MSPEEARRHYIRQSLHEDLERSIDERVDRFVTIMHQWVIPAHHFAQASAECIHLYRDGYFLSAVMVSQAVNEGIWKFILERDNLPYDPDRKAQADDLVERRIISRECADASLRIFRSFRNDFHHMNPRVAGVPVLEIAPRNILDLALIEREIFAVTFPMPGKMTPVHRRYWDVGPDGTTTIFLRNA